MELRRVVGIGASSLLAGCALISGAATLEVGALPDAPRDGAAADVGEAGMALRPDANAGAPDDPGAGEPTTKDGAPSTRLREVTFESGSLLASKDSADVALGVPTLETLLPIAGKFSVRFDNDQAVEIDFGPAPEIYAAFLVRLDNVGLGSPAFVRIGTDTPSVVDLELAPNKGGIAVRLGTDVLGTGAGIVDTNAVYRVGIHLRRAGMKTSIEVFVASRGVAFGGASIASAGLSGLGNIRYLQIGAIGDVNVRGVFDDILVDTAVMPPP